jgi:hypothetical protein
MCKRVLAFILLGCAATLAQEVKTVDRTAFGFTLGERLSVPDCATEKIGQRAYIRQPVAEICVNVQSASAKGRTVMIYFPWRSKPGLISGDAISGIMVAGKLEGIGFNTGGLSDQEKVLSQLTAKYGEPSAQKSAAGRFNALAAEWNLDGVTVTFLGAAASTESGLVTIDTSKGREIRTAALRDATFDPRPL